MISPLTKSLAEILDELDGLANGGQVSAGEVVDRLGVSSLTAVLLVPALLVITPLSGIPLFSATCGIAIALIGVQLIFARDGLWLPRWLRRQKISAERLQHGIAWLRQPAKWVDRRSHERFRWLSRQPFINIPRAICVVCGALMPVFEFVPFSSTLLGVVVTIFAFAMLHGDGLILLGAYILAVMVGSLIIYLAF